MRKAISLIARGPAPMTTAAAHAQAPSWPLSRDEGLFGHDMNDRISAIRRVR